jgi:hypothetical protein
MKNFAFHGKLKALGGGSMGLKFQREDSLDKMFDEFAILPDIDKDNKKQQNDIERFLEKENDENKKAEKTKEPKKAD